MKPQDPFERHPAKYVMLEDRAGQLVAFAEQASDQQAVTDRAFEPAVAAWDGLAAPELREAPEPLRKEAQEVASQLAWAAVPLRYWADQVREFNAKVDDLQKRVDEIPAEVERRLRERFGDDLLDLERGPEFPSARSVIRGEILHELEQEWHTAFSTYIDDGEQTTVTMFRDGPTWENLETARQVGALPEGQLAAFLTAEWRWAAAIEEAPRIIERIRDPDQIPSEQELAWLAEIMDAHADNEEFAYLLLAELGPAGLIETNIALVALQREGEGPLGSLVSIQQGLGVALATATTRRGAHGSAPGGGGERYYPAEHELPPEWVHELTAAGRSQYPTRPDGMTSERIYGYQMLGPLLAQGRYDEWFLQTVGGDLIDFEKEMGGSELWQGTYSTGPLDLTRLQADDDPTFSYDPMVGLMEAFEANPYGARAALAGTVEALEAGGTHLPRVDYLVTDRAWGSGDGVGLDILGRVLEHATGITMERGDDGELHHLYPPDDRSHRIVEAIVHAVATDNVVTETPIEERNVVPDPLRPHLGRIAAGYIDDMHWSMLGGHSPDSVPGDQKATVDPRDLEYFLAELGRNAEARETVTLAEEFYVGTLYDYYLSGEGGHHDPLVAAENNVIDPAARMFAALDVGAATQIDANWEEQVAAHNRELENRQLVYQIGTRLVGDALEAAIPSDAIVFMVNELLEQRLGDERLDPPVGQADWEIGSMLELSEQRMQEQAMLGAYRHADPAELPEYVREALVEDGELKPIEEWYRPDSQEYQLWRDYLNSEGVDSEARTLESVARETYYAEYDAANHRLAGSRLER